MAKFQPDINPTNDPNYLGYSKEPDKVKGDSSLGSLFSDLGAVGTGIIKGVDAFNQESIRSDLYTAIDRVRAEHGSDITPNEVPAIAGKGGRGSKFEAASGDPSQPLDMDAVPDGVNASVSGLRRMAQARDAGKLSDSHYYASLEAEVSKIRSRYPMYREQIDSMVSTITGVTPANALRSSILRDMNSMAAAAGSADAKLQTRYHSDNAEIQTLYPGMTFEQYKAKAPQVDVAVGQLKSIKLQTDYKKNEFELMDKTDQRKGTVATQNYRDIADLEVRSFFTGAKNASGIDLKALSQEISRGAVDGIPPDRIKEITGQLSRAELVLKQRIQNQSGPYVRFISPQDRAAIEEDALNHIRTLKTAIGTKDWTVANATANLMQLRNTEDQKRLEDQFPTVRAMGALRKAVGDPAAAIALQHSGLLSEKNKAFVDGSWLQVYDKDSGKAPPTVTQMYDAAKKVYGKPPGQVMGTITDNVWKMVQHPDKDIAERAVTSLYSDPTFFAKLAPDQKLSFLQKIASQDTTNRIKTLSPAAQTQYYNFVENAWKAVFDKGAADLQSVIINRNMEWDFDPRTFQFKGRNKANYSPRGSKAGDRPPGVNDPAETRLSEINQGLAVLAPVLKERYKGQELQHVADLLRQMGVDFAAPKEGNLLNELGAAIWKKFVGEQSQSGLKPGETRDLGITVDDIPAGMSARDFLKMLQTGGANPR